VINDFRNQTITVNVDTGAGSGTASVTASGTSIDLSGTQNLSMGATTQLLARLTSGVNEPIANEPIEITSSAGHAIVVDRNSRRLKHRHYRYNDIQW